MIKLRELLKESNDYEQVGDLAIKKYGKQKLKKANEKDLIKMIWTASVSILGAKRAKYNHHYDEDYLSDVISYVGEKIDEIKEGQFIDNPHLKEFGKRLEKSQVLLFKKTAESALAFKNSKPGDKEYFSASTPVKKYAVKYSVKQLENQVKYLNQYWTKLK